MTKTERKEIIQKYREAYPAVHRMALVFGNCRIRVTANSEHLIDELTTYYGTFVTPDAPDNADIGITVHEAPTPELPERFTVRQPDPGKTKIKEEYLDLANGRIVRKRLTGMIFVFGEGENLAIGPCMENSNQVVNFINNRFIEWELCRGCLLGHAAGVICDGKGLALAGFSGAGKSTLALHIMSRGATFVSNDRLMIEQQDSGLIMYGVAKLPRINPGTILNNPDLASVMTADERRRFSGLPKAELWNLEYKYDAPIDICFGPDRFELDAPMNALAILNWKHGAGPMSVREVRLSERADLLPAFMKSTGLFFTPCDGCGMPEPSAENYAQYLSLCRVLEFSGGVDFKKAAEICVTFLKTGVL
ncbi:hypothetical protein DENIS_0572 [Desulfonema ishimotonii]|uniref:HprK-related kinase B n=1 Tax=Desulfonema ishimotonii TaxID=45657 RepID=A0A401FRQ2_9BACT|nr:HprK-related kinase B [Desulfonema ishimotonii]GBC59633.1 hypothetical protein DENIS_0572 [Desulfonema ishimotonii]